MERDRRRNRRRRHPKSSLVCYKPIRDEKVQEDGHEIQVHGDPTDVLELRHGAQQKVLHERNSTGTR